ncbi:MAG: hypothetical protein ACLQF0_15820 [Dissulfurispiraceae bacterium]
MISDISTTSSSLVSGITASGNTTTTQPGTDSSTTQSETVTLSDEGTVMQTLLAQTPSLARQMEWFNNTYNAQLAQNQAQNIVSEAKTDGVSLDYNTVYNQVKLQNGIMDKNDIQNWEAQVKSGRFQLSNLPLSLTQNELAVLHSAYENGVPLDVIDYVATHLSAANVTAENKNMLLPEFNMAYLDTLLQTAQKAGDSIDASGVQNFMKNFNTISAAGNSSTTADA